MIFKGGGGGDFLIKLNLFVFFAINCFVVDSWCSYKFVLARWADRNYSQSLGLGTIFRSFFFTFSKANVLNINLTKIFLICQFDDENSQYTKLDNWIFLINGGPKYCVKIEKTTINFLSSTQKEYIHMDYCKVRLHFLKDIV